MARVRGLLVAEGEEGGEEEEEGGEEAEGDLPQVFLWDFQSAS